MIFSGFGNAPAHMSFDRMAKAVDEFAKISEEEVLVQSGNTQYQFKYAKAKASKVRYLSMINSFVGAGGAGAFTWF